MTVYPRGGSSPSLPPWRLSWREVGLKLSLQIWISFLRWWHWVRQRSGVALSTVSKCSNCMLGRSSDCVFFFKCFCKVLRKSSKNLTSEQTTENLWLQGSSCDLIWSLRCYFPAYWMWEQCAAGVSAALSFLSAEPDSVDTTSHQSSAFPSCSRRLGGDGSS